jgi:hypothetical protein
VVKFEEFLGMKRTDIDIEKMWSNDNPMKTGKSFEEEFLRVRGTRVIISRPNLNELM